MHVPIMVGEVLEALRPRPGDRVLDCTIGGGGHARALLDRILPGGRLVGIDVDGVELGRTEARLRADGVGADVFTARCWSFADLPRLLNAEGLTHVDVLLADLGVSSMQHDDPARGFSYKAVGPLDMRMDQSCGQPASALIGQLSEADLARLLDENADEPHAVLIARLLKEKPLATSHAAEKAVRLGLERARPSSRFIPARTGGSSTRFARASAPAFTRRSPTK